MQQPITRSSFIMSDILSNIIMHAKNKRNMTHNQEKNQSIERARDDRNFVIKQRGLKRLHLFKKI